MGQALRSLEGEVTLIDCVTELGFTQCSISLRCRMRKVWLEANSAVMEILDRTTIADLCSPRTADLIQDNKASGPDTPEGLNFNI